MQSPVRVLHVDDDPSVTDLTATFLERETDRFSVETSHSVVEAQKRLKTATPDCIVSDYKMPGADGIEFLKAVRESFPALPFILYTSHGSETIASEAISAGVTDYIQKEYGTEQYLLLANRIENAVARYRSQKTAKDQQRQLELLFEESPFGAIQWDERFHIERLNKRAEQILGRTEQELRDESWETIVASDDREMVREAVTDLLANEGGSRVINKNVTQAGEVRVCEWHNRVITDADGAVVSVFSKFRDITDQDTRKKELQQYETIINALTDAVYVVDEEGRFSYVNDEFVELVGYDRERILGSTPSLIKSDDAVVAAEDALRTLLSSEGPEKTRFEVTVLPKDGDPVVCQDHMSVLPYYGERFNGSVGILRDITERKARERALTRQNERLDEFASVVAHDLRNPLNVAKGRAELLAADRDDPHIVPLTTALERIEAIIGDTLTLAQNGERVGEMEPVSVSEVIHQSWEMIDAPAATLRVDDDVRIRADAARLRHICENLLRNAVKHGGDDVTIAVGQSGDSTIYVEDSGSGIEKADREVVFELGHTSEPDGTGFGLAIVKRLAEAHQWDVTLADSTLGGARFEFHGVEIL